MKKVYALIVWYHILARQRLGARPQTLRIGARRQRMRKAKHHLSPNSGEPKTLRSQPLRACQRISRHSVWKRCVLVSAFRVAGFVNAVPVSAFCVSVWEGCACQRISRECLGTLCFEMLHLSAHFASVFGNSAPVSAFRVTVFGNVVPVSAFRVAMPRNAALVSEFRVAFLYRRCSCERISRDSALENAAPVSTFCVTMLRNAAPVSAFLVSVWERCACQRILGHSVWTCALTDLKMNLHGCAVCAAARYVCRQDIRTFAFG